MNITQQELENIVNETNISFTGNDTNEIEITFEFADEDEAYDALYKVNEKGDIEVSLDVYDLSEDAEAEEYEDDEYGEPVKAVFFFNISESTIEDINDTIDLIKSV